MRNRRLLLILLVFIIATSYIYQGIYVPKDVIRQPKKLFLIERGMGAKEIALKLEKERLIKNEKLFQLHVFLTGKAGILQAGEYLISSNMTIPEIADKLVKGVIAQETITIIEGWDIRDIAYYFENMGKFQAEGLFEVAGFTQINYSENQDLPRPKDFSEKFGFLEDKPKNLGLEGYLFPDTYQVIGRESVEEIIDKMLSNFNNKLNLELRKEITKQEKAIFEIITMASLIEKEVITLEDKKIVSGLLWKRMENGIPLQIDATLTYITGKNTTAISKEETQIDSPYNTYKYRGLPQGPICNPGMESILAAIYPEESEYFYYLSTPEGETIFSKTLKEHNIAKAKYLK